MDHIKQQISDYALVNSEEAETCTGLGIYVGALGVFRCDICKGFGHTARRCTTKKTIDGACRGNPPWKVVWGSVKGEQRQLLGKRRAKQTLKRLEAEIKAHKQSAAANVSNAVSSLVEESKAMEH